jgi:hypothetical protein
MNFFVPLSLYGMFGCGLFGMGLFVSIYETILLEEVIWQK